MHLSTARSKEPDTLQRATQSRNRKRSAAQRGGKKRTHVALLGVLLALAVWQVAARGGDAALLAARLEGGIALAAHPRARSGLGEDAVDEARCALDLQAN